MIKSCCMYTSVLIRFWGKRILKFSQLYQNYINTIIFLTIFCFTEYDTSKNQRNAIVKFYQVRNYFSPEIAFKINGQIKLPLPDIWFESFLSLIAKCIFGQSFEFAFLYFPRYVTHAGYVQYNTNSNLTVL